MREQRNPVRGGEARFLGSIGALKAVMEEGEGASKETARLANCLPAPWACCNAGTEELGRVAVLPAGALPGEPEPGARDPGPPGGARGVSCKARAPSWTSVVRRGRT